MPEVDGAVLTSPAPEFAHDDIARFVAEAYGVAGRVAGKLGSERDQVVVVADGKRELVVKVSNASESRSSIDLEESAAVWAVAVDPTLPLNVPLTVGDSDVRHILVRHPATGSEHFLRVFERLPGQASLSGADLSRATVIEYGEITARTARAMRGFFHPAASRHLLWHAEKRDQARALAGHILQPETRALVEGAFAGFEERVAPRWASFRAQVVHGDLSLDNLLVDGETVTGVLDLGDLTFTTLVFDLAPALCSLAGSLQGDDLFRVFRLFLDGYQSVTPLEPEEIAALGDTIAVRAAATLCISSWRTTDHPGNTAYIQAGDETALSLLRQFRSLGHETITRQLGGPVPAPDTDALTQRRAAAFGTALAPLSYARPLHVVSGRGATMTDSAGTTYIDAYNNVPVVGHAHPRVSSRIADQSRVLSTNLRYLHPRAIELAERLLATMPPDLTGPEGIDTVLLVNSGSEATDMAWRLAMSATGRTGALVTEFAYHGVTAATTALSPEEWRGGWTPGYVERFAAPRGAEPDVGDFRSAVDRLRTSGHEPAMLMVDTTYTSDGILSPGPAYHGALGAAAREAGALVVADEVQAGFGRTGEHLWSFHGAGLVPDVVTLGKPMGNGYPLAAVITRSTYVEALGREAEFFSTFAGSPVAAVAGLAVLEVIDDEGLVAHAAAMGDRLRTGLREATADCAVVRDVRGRGLLIGVDLAGMSPADVSAVADRTRDQGVLIGTTGPRYDVLKVRPPLVITADQVDRVVTAVASAIRQIADC